MENKWCLFLQTSQQEIFYLPVQKNRTLHSSLSFAKEPILDNGLETKVKTITSPEPHYPTFLHDCFSGITMDLYSIMNSFLQPNFADHHSWWQCYLPMVSIWSFMVQNQYYWSLPLDVHPWWLVDLMDHSYHYLLNSVRLSRKVTINVNLQNIQFEQLHWTIKTSEKDKLWKIEEKLRSHSINSVRKVQLSNHN